MTIYVALDMNYVTPMLRTTLEDDGISVFGTLWFIAVVGVCVFSWAVFWWVFGRILLESEYSKREETVGWLLVVMTVAEPLCCYYITIHVVAQAVFGVEPGMLERLPYPTAAVLGVLLTAYFSLGRRAIQKIVYTQFEKGKSLFAPTEEEELELLDANARSSQDSSGLYQIWTTFKNPAIFLVLALFIGTQFFLRRVDCFSADNGFWSFDAISDLTNTVIFLGVLLYALGQSTDSGKQAVDDWLQRAAVYLRERAAHFALIFMAAYVASPPLFNPSFLVT
jgi:hypothetical protein